MTDLYYAYTEREKSHEMLFHILKTYRGLTAEERDLTFNENGKPSLGADYPYFSITHTTGLVMVALSDRPVGIDAEKTGRKLSGYRALTERFFAEEERLKIGSDFDFLAVWTKKESAVKFFGGDVTAWLSRIVFDGDSPKGTDALSGATTVTRRLGEYVYSVTSLEPAGRPLLLL
ncbi:MAG: 4'-phosphopantetheinyl transferase superfamily protein [Candidatus Borkfalkiaceae bacterium]|nr:4'-phosphopantetheinyl transferase superfamily protein [Christensenellaceae bacterium]